MAGRKIALRSAAGIFIIVIIIIMVIIMLLLFDLQCFPAAQSAKSHFENSY